MTALANDRMPAGNSTSYVKQLIESSNVIFYFLI